MIESRSPGRTDPTAKARFRWLWRVITTLLVAVVGVGAWMACRGAYVSLQAEQNLHDTIFTIRLVDAFVLQNGRWPSSWEELESLPISEELNERGWPAVSTEIQRRVHVDFQAD